MSDPFRTRVESPQEPEIDAQQVKPQETYKLKGGETKTQDEPNIDEKNLEVWEGLNRRKFITEYFPIKEFADEFGLKMQISQIDKYVRGELEKIGYEKNIENYEKILEEIENEIGSRPLELFTRIKKLTGYVRAINRLEDAKKKKQLYMESFDNGKSL